MKHTTWLNDDNAALFTDLYQLTMLQAYYRERMFETAVFDLFVRRLRHRNFLIACGLDTVLHYLENLHFPEHALEHLASLGLFEADFIEWLADFRFTGEVYAVREGTPIFADEPILEVVAPIGEAQLVETFLLNQITFQTGIASKAIRVVYAAQGRSVADFGMRRMHGGDAALKAARACHIAGVETTSNVLAGQIYGLPVSGTMAHSYIEAHDLEEDAFRSFASIYPDTTLLVDTYDTLEGVDKVISLSRAEGSINPVGAIRLDSGNLADLARQARSKLDRAGLSEVQIVASGSLDEYSILELVSQKAPIDGFGVGTRMGTMSDQPYLDTAYKLSAYAGKCRMKLAAEKSNLPCRKQVYRHFKQNRAIRDVIAEAEEPQEGVALLECVMHRGRRTAAGNAALSAIKSYCQTAVATLPESLFSLEQVQSPYLVEPSDNLNALMERLRADLARTEADARR